MTLYRVMNANEVTNEEAVGVEIRRLHRTMAGAQIAIERADWDPDWGVPPVLEVGSQTYASEDDARSDGFEVVD